MWFLIRLKEPKMNGAHLHLMLIHFPIAGMILALPLLLGAWKLKDETLKRVGLSFVVLVGLLGYAAYLSGGGAVRVVRNLPDITRDTIHEHAQAADWAIWIIAADALLAGFGLFCAWKDKKMPHWVFPAVALLTLLGSTVLVRVAYLVGQIHHPETRAGFTAPAGGQGK